MWVARVVFVAAVVLIPLQLLVKVTAGREPYPALTQPAFAYAANPLAEPDVITSAVAEVEVTFADGSIETFTADELIEWTAGISTTIMLTESMIDRAPAAETVAWLADRIADARAGATAISAHVKLYSVSVYAPTLVEVDRYLTDEITVPLPERP